MCEDLLHQNSPKLLRNMGSIASNSMMQSMPVTELTFVELLFSQQRFINNSHSELHKNSVKDSVNDTKSQIERQTNMVSKLLFFF
jgi:uncharacterized membrane protein